MIQNVNDKLSNKVPCRHEVLRAPCFQVVHPFDYLGEGESSQYVVLLTRLNLQVTSPSALAASSFRFGGVGLYPTAAVANWRRRNRRPPE